MADVRQVPAKSSGDSNVDYKNLANSLNQIVDKLQWQIYNMERSLTKTTTYTATRFDRVLLCNATGGAFTVTLPPAEDMWQRDMIIIKIDAGANAVTVDGNASETINGSATQSLASQWSVIHIFSDGTQWIKA